MAAIRDAAAAFAMAAVRHEQLVVDLTGVELGRCGDGGQAVVEGVLLARYRYRVFRDIPNEAHLRGLTIVVERGQAPGRPGRCRARRDPGPGGQPRARPGQHARRTHLTATRFGKVAKAIGPEAGLDVEVFDQKDLVKMGCGGLLGVNAGSAEEARLIKLTYTPSGTLARASRARRQGDHVRRRRHQPQAVRRDARADEAGHVRRRRPSSGRCPTLRDLGCKSTVTGYLMCTDNMPSGTATRLGDVLTIRGGKTVEVVNADAEGRLVMADGIVLAVEDGADAIVTVATLTGAAMRTFGTALAPVLGNSPAVVDGSCARPARRSTSRCGSCRSSGATAASSTRRSPTSRTWAARTPARSPPACSSTTSSTAPRSAISTSAARWSTDRDDGWRPTGATAFGTRLLAAFALDFRKPAA